VTLGGGGLLAGRPDIPLAAALAQGLVDLLELGGSGSRRSGSDGRALHDAKGEPDPHDSGVKLVHATFSRRHVVEPSGYAPFRGGDNTDAAPDGAENGRWRV